MRTRSRTLLAALAAVTLCAAVTATASANRISLSTNQVRSTWSEFTVNSSGGSISCPLTLERTFHSTSLNKTVNLLLGYVTRAATDTSRCTGAGTATVLAETPWHMRYDLFFGTLPAIGGFRISYVGMGFLVTILGQSCLYLSTAASPARVRVTLESRGVETGIRWLEEASVPFSRGSFICPASVTLAGTGTSTVQGETAPISVRLIV